MSIALGAFLIGKLAIVSSMLVIFAACSFASLQLRSTPRGS